jgi:hypothetical protein
MDLLIGIALSVALIFGLIFLSVGIGKLAGWLSGNNESR